VVFYPSNLMHYRHQKSSHIHAKCTLDIISFSCSYKAHCKINYITQKLIKLSTKEDNSVNTQKIRDTFSYNPQAEEIVLCKFLQISTQTYFCQMADIAKFSVLITISTRGWLSTIAPNFYSADIHSNYTTLSNHKVKVKVKVKLSV
jgi:hypothetical protein